MCTINLFGDAPPSREKRPAPENFSAYRERIDVFTRQAIGHEIRRRAAKLTASSYSTNQKQGKQLALQADRFCSCGTQFALFTCDTDRWNFRSPISCNSRICEQCGRRIERNMTRSIENALAPLFRRRRRSHGVFMLTLTTTTDRYQDRTPNRRDIQRLYEESGKFFRLFYGKYRARLTKRGAVIEDTRRTVEYRDDAGRRRRRKKEPTGTRRKKDGTAAPDFRTWQGYGYIAALEFAPKNNMLHVHAIVYGRYVSQRQLSAAWLKLTGDSAIVDIRAIRSPKTATKYVLKYVCKPPKGGDHIKLVDYLMAIQGSRRLRAGGVFYGKIRPDQRPKLARSCPFCDGCIAHLGTYSLESDTVAAALPLYQLLRERSRTNDPLPRPPTAADRARAEALQREIERLEAKAYAKQWWQQEKARRLRSAREFMDTWGRYLRPGEAKIGPDCRIIVQLQDGD